MKAQIRQTNKNILKKSIKLHKQSAVNFENVFF